MVAWCLDEGLEVIYINLEDSGLECVTRHPNALPVGTYQSRGMQWSTEFREMQWDLNYEFFMNRTNTVTGERYIDNPRLMWNFNNENFFQESFNRATYYTWGGTFSSAGTTSIGSAQITGMDAAMVARLRWGMRITGTGISGTQTILTIDGPTSITISSTFAAAATNNYTFTMYRFDRLIEDISDSYSTVNGDAGYWYTELNAKLVAWRDVNAPSWTIPDWGRGCTRAGAIGGAATADGVSGWPRLNTFQLWPTTADKNYLRDCIIDLELEYTTWLLTQMRALRSDVIVNPSTALYCTMQAITNLPTALQENMLLETHHYFDSAFGPGSYYTGSYGSRCSVFDPAWTPEVLNNSGWGDALTGNWSTYTGYLAGECGQYGMNRWRYQRLYYEMLSSLLNGYEVGSFAESQQYLITSYKTDGRYMKGDNQGVASPTHHLAARAVAPAIRFSFMEEYTDTFVIYAMDADFRARQYTQGLGMQGAELWTSYGNQGTGSANWGGKKVRFDFSTTTTTSDFSTWPTVLNAPFAAGIMVRGTTGGTESEKLYMRRGAPGTGGAQFYTPYMAGYIDTLREKTAADTIFTQMPLYIVDGSMAGAEVCSVCFLRSDGPWEMFKGPMKLYIHGSDYSEDGLNWGFNNSGGTVGGVLNNTYGEGTPGAFSANNPPGVAHWMANDEVTCYCTSGTSEDYGSGNPTPADTWLMMPDTFTVAMDTTNNGLNPSGVNCSIYGVTVSGLPVLIPSTYDTSTKVLSFNYTATYPEYIVAPNSPTDMARGSKGS